MRYLGARWLNVVVVVLALIGLQRTAAAQQGFSEGCIAGNIEKWMREYQARYLFVQKAWRGFAPFAGDPVALAWPPRAADDWTPAFPPDHYYDEAIRRDPAFAASLVNAVKGAFFQGVVWSDESGDYTPLVKLFEYYVKDDWQPDGFRRPNVPVDPANPNSGLTPGVPVFNWDDFHAAWLEGDGSTHLLFNTPVTPDNYCLVFAYLQQALGKLTRVHWYMFPECLSEGQDCLRDALGVVENGADAAATFDAAYLRASRCWDPNYCGDPLCCQNNPPVNCPPPYCVEVRGWRPCVCGPQVSLGVIRATEYGEFTGTTDQLGIHYTASVSWSRSAARFHQHLQGLSGNFGIYVAATPLANGSNNIASPVDADDKYHALVSGSGDQDWYSPIYGQDNSAPTGGSNPVAVPTASSSVGWQRGWQIIAGDDGYGGYTFGAVSVFTPAFDTRADPPTIGHGCRTCGTNAYPSVPAVSFSDGRPSVSWALGGTPAGLPAGTLQLRGDVSATTVDAAALLYSTRNSVYHAGGTIQTGLARVEVSNIPQAPNSDNHKVVELKFFRGGETAEYSKTTLEYRENQLVPDPASPAQLTTGTVLNISTEGHCEQTAEFHHVNGNWELATGVTTTATALRRERVVNTVDPAGPYAVQTSTVVNPDSVVGTTVAASQEVRFDFPWGSEVVQRSAGTGSTAIVENMYFDTDAEVSGQPNPGYGQIKLRTRSGGYWEFYRYAADGGVSRIVTPFKNNSYPSCLLSATPCTQAAIDSLIAANRSVAINRYSLVLTGSSVPSLVTERITYLPYSSGSFAAERSYEIAWGIPSGATECKKWTVRCADATPPTSAAAVTTFLNSLIGHTRDGSQTNLVTVEWFQLEGSGPTARPLTDRPTRVERPDGSITTYTYAESSGVLTTTVDSGPGDSAGAAFRGGSRTVSVRNALGVVISTTTYDLIDTATPLTLTTTGDLDDFGRPQSVTYSNGTTAETAYGCCGVESQTSTDGAVTSYPTYDALKRPTIMTTAYGSSTQWSRTTYDAAGQVTAEERSLDNSTWQTVRTNTYDLAGRMTSTTDALGSTTTYAEQFVTGGGVLSTQTLPDPDGTGTGYPLLAPVTYDYRYADGHAAWRNGGTDPNSAGAHPTASDYGVEVPSVTGYSTAMRFTKQASGDSSSQWSKTYVNALGQPVLTVLADGAVSTTTFDARGRMFKQVSPDGQAQIMLSGYGEDDPSRPPDAPVATDGISWAGPWQLVAQLASSAASTINFAGDDRIMLTRSELGTHAVGSTNVPVRRSIQRVWTTSAGSTPSTDTYVTSTSESSLDGLRSWQTSAGKETSTVTTYPTTTTRDVTTTLPNSETQVEHYEYGRLVSSTHNSSTNALMRKTVTSYDGYGRVSQSKLVIDASNSSTDAVTDYQYDDVDRIKVQTDPEPVESGTPAGRPVTTFTYDKLGRQTVIDHGSGMQTYRSYLPTGELYETAGFGVTPVRYVYDDHGRMTELHTFTDWVGQSGEAVTKWVYSSDRGLMVSKVYADNSAVTYDYTPGGRLATRSWARTFGGDPIKTTYGYTHFGELESTAYTDGTPTVETLYDRLGRPYKIHDAAGVRTFAYSSPTRLTDEDIVADTASGYDLLAGVHITHGYDTLDRRKHLTTAISSYSKTVDFDFDSSWRLNKVTKDGMVATYQFDPRTGLVSQTKHATISGTTQTDVAIGNRTYDHLGRLTALTWERSGVSNPIKFYGYDYDAFGRRTQAHEEIEQLDWMYGYDDMGQLTSAKRKFQYPQNSSAPYLPGEEFGYSYDDIGNRTEIAEGGNAAGTPAGLNTSQYQTNALNQYTNRDVPSDVEVVYQAQSNATTTVTVNGSAATHVQDTYFHRRVSLGNNSSAPLLSAISITEPGVFSGGNQVYLPQTPEAFEYDADGNLTLDGVWEYEWDGENRLKAMQLRPAAAGVMFGTDGVWVRLEFAYDYMGRRISKKFLKTGDAPPTEKQEKGKGDTYTWGTSGWWKYVYDTSSWNLSLSYVASIPTGAFNQAERSYAWGPDLSGTPQGAGGIGGLAIEYDEQSSPSSNPGPMFPVFDGNGNVVRLCRAGLNGSSGGAGVGVVAAYEYGPFGEVRSVAGPQSLGNPFRWSTKFTDVETGLVYYGYRYYSPGVGRWLSRDPSGENSDINTMVFVGNSPAGAVDALGLAKVKYTTADAVYLDFSVGVTGGANFRGIPVGIQGTVGMQLVANCRSRELTMFGYGGVGGGLTRPGLGISAALFGGGFVYELLNNAAYAGPFWYATFGGGIDPISVYYSRFWDATGGPAYGWQLELSINRSILKVKTPLVGGSILTTWNAGAFFGRQWYRMRDSYPLGVGLQRRLCTGPAVSPSCPSFPDVPPNGEGIDGRVRFVTGNFDVDIIDDRATDDAVGHLFGTAVPALMSYLPISAKTFINAAEQRFAGMAAGSFR